MRFQNTSDQSFSFFLLFFAQTRIQQLKKRAVRLIYRLHKYDHITEYYNRLRWLKFPQLVHLTLSVLFSISINIIQEGFHFFVQFSLGIRLVTILGLHHILPIQFNVS